MRGRTRRSARIWAPVLVAALAAPVLVPSTVANADPPPAFELFEPDATSQSWANSYLLALLSHFVYLQPLGATEADFEEKFAAKFEPMGLTNIDYFKDDLSDAEAAVGETDDAIIVSFRGTETASPTELGDVVDLVLDLAIGSSDGIHFGFRTQALALIDEVRAAIEGAPGKKVWLTGHSLGGSVATATAYLLETDDDPIDVQGVYAYGAPRVFMEERLLINPDAAAAYEALFPGGRHQRFVNNHDPIPHIAPPIPLVIPYRHVGQLNNILPDGDGCKIDLDTTELALIDLEALIELVADVGIVDALPAIGEAVLLAADIGDHDTKEYASRIYAHLPVELRVQMPEPPYPDVAQTTCDEPQDNTPPEVTANVTGTLGDDGWYTSDVSVSWTVTDDESDVSSTTGCGDAGVTADTTGTTFTCSATSDGGTTEESVTIKRDATAPTGVAVDPDRAPDSNGWYNAPFTATWTGSDATSDIASCTETTYSGPDTSTGSLGGTCTDQAGNESASVSFAFMYDATAPEITIAAPWDDADYLLAQEVGAVYACSDGLSTVASCTGPVASGAPIDTSAFGAHTFTVDATDQAGNTATLTHDYTVTYAFSGFSSPLDPLPTANRAKAGQAISARWNLFDSAGAMVEDQPELFQAGWSAKFTCAVSSADTIESYESAGESGLRWDADAQQYVFTAKSAKGDSGSCRYLIVRAGSGRVAKALVHFVR